MADGANFESLNFEISVNTKEAAQGVRLLRNAVTGLGHALREISGLNVNHLFAGISESAKQAAAEVKIAEQDIRKALDKLSAEAGIKDKVDASLAMQNTFWSFEQQTALYDALESARDWPSMMANSMWMQPGAGASGAEGEFYEVEEAADEATSSTMSLADAMQMVRNAMSSVSETNGAVQELYNVKAATDNVANSAENAGGRVEGSFSRISEVVGGFGESIDNAIKSTRAYSQVSKTLETTQAALAPAMQAVGVSTEAMNEAFAAAVGPITAVVLAIQVAVKVATFLVDQFNEFNAAMKKVVDTAKAINEKYNPFVALKKELESLLALAKRQIMRRAINAVIKSITEGLRSGIENLAEYDEQFSATMESFRNAMGLFKNSIGVAVAPIISYFIPAINALLSALTRAMNTLARLTALLTGQHTYTIAKDYQEIGESAGGASGKVKELQRTILGFDEINKLNGQNGSGSGGGGGAGDSINSYLTEEVGDWPYDSWGEAFLAFVDWLDRTGVPALQTGLNKVADVVNTFSTNLADMFSYEGVQEAISRLGTDIGEAVNNFFTGDPGNGGLNWQEMGRAFGQTIKSIFNFAASFLTPLNFFEFGRKIAEFVGSAFQQITPEDIRNMAYTLSTPIRAVIGMALGFLTSAPLPDIMEKVGQFVNGLIEAIGKAIGGGTGEKGGEWQSYMQIAAQNIANGLASFLSTVNWPALFNTLTTLVSGIISGLETILDRLMKDKEFVNAVRQFVDFIINTAVKWFMLKVKAITGLAGNMSLGRMLGAALFGGSEGESLFGDGLGFFGSSFSEQTIADFTYGMEDATDAVDDLNSAVSKGAPTINQYGKTMRDNMSSVTTAAVNANNAVRDNTIGVSGVTAHLSKMATNSGKPTTDTGNAIKGVGTAAKDAASEVKRQTIGQTGSVTAFLKKMKVDGSDYADKLGSNIQSKLSTAATKAAESAGSIKKSVVDSVGGAKDAVAQQNWNGVGGQIKAGINSGMTIFQGDLKGWANQFKAEIKREFNIKSPSRWARDEVGGNIGEGIALGLTDSMSSVEDACSGLKEGIAGEFSGMSVLDGVGATMNRNRGVDFATALGNQVMSALATMQTSRSDQPIVCEVYLDRDRIATAVTLGQQNQNRRYSPTRGI